MANQSIACNVHTCKHNHPSNYCNLSKITVGNEFQSSEENNFQSSVGDSMQSGAEACCKEDTICSSFEAKTM